MMSTNTIQGVVLLVIGIFGLMEQFELLMFERIITFIFLGLGKWNYYFRCFSDFWSFIVISFLAKTQGINNWKINGTD